MNRNPFLSGLSQELRSQSLEEFSDVEILKELFLEETIFGSSGISEVLTIIRREAIKRLGEEPRIFNPSVPTDVNAGCQLANLLQINKFHKISTIVAKNTLLRSSYIEDDLIRSIYSNGLFPVLGRSLICIGNFDDAYEVLWNCAKCYSIENRVGRSTANELLFILSFLDHKIDDAREYLRLSLSDSGDKLMETIKRSRITYDFNHRTFAKYNIRCEIDIITELSISNDLTKRISCARPIYEEIFLSVAKYLVNDSDIE